MSWKVNAKRLMDAQELNYEHLMEAFGVRTPGGVGHYFSGRNKIKVEQFFRLANTLGVTAQDLFMGDLDYRQAPIDIGSIHPRDRVHLQAVIRAFEQSAPWDGTTERRRPSPQHHRRRRGPSDKF